MAEKSLKKKVLQFSSRFSTPEFPKIRAGKREENEAQSCANIREKETPRIFVNFYSVCPLD